MKPEDERQCDDGGNCCYTGILRWIVYGRAISVRMNDDRFYSLTTHSFSMITNSGWHFCEFTPIESDCCGHALRRVSTIWLRYSSIHYPVMITVAVLSSARYLAYRINASRSLIPPTSFASMSARAFLSIGSHTRSTSSPWP